MEATILTEERRATTFNTAASRNVHSSNDRIRQNALLDPNMPVQRKIQIATELILWISVDDYNLNEESMQTYREYEAFLLDAGLKILDVFYSIRSPNKKIEETEAARNKKALMMLACAVRRDVITEKLGDGVLEAKHKYVLARNTDFPDLFAAKVFPTFNQTCDTNNAFSGLINMTLRLLEFKRNEIQNLRNTHTGALPFEDPWSNQAEVSAVQLNEPLDKPQDNKDNSADGESTNEVLRRRLQEALEEKARIKARYQAILSAFYDRHNQIIASMGIELELVKEIAMQMYLKLKINGIVPLKLDNAEETQVIATLENYIVEHVTNAGAKVPFSTSLTVLEPTETLAAGKIVSDQPQVSSVDLANIPGIDILALERHIEKIKSEALVALGSNSVEEYLSPSTAKGTLDFDEHQQVLDSEAKPNDLYKATQLFETNAKLTYEHIKDSDVFKIFLKLILLRISTLAITPNGVTGLNLENLVDFEGGQSAKFYEEVYEMKSLVEGNESKTISKLRTDETVIPKAMADDEATILSQQLLSEEHMQSKIKRARLEDFMAGVVKKLAIGTVGKTQDLLTITSEDGTKTSVVFDKKLLVSCVLKGLQELTQNKIRNLLPEQSTQNKAEVRIYEAINSLSKVNPSGYIGRLRSKF